MDTENPHMEHLRTLALDWAALSNGLLAVEALLATRGPQPSEPALDAPKGEVEVWVQADLAWHQAGDKILEDAGIRPAVISSRRHLVEEEIYDVLSLLPEFDDGGVDAFVLLEKLTELLDAEAGWVVRAWKAFRSSPNP